MLIWIQANLPMVLGVLLGISEALALIPSIKANSVVGLVIQGLTWLQGVVGKQTPPAA